jgi:hypothetical protein
LHCRYKGRLGSSLERWKWANDWLLMLIVYCAGRVPGPWGIHRFKVAPLLENKAKPQAIDEPASIQISEPSCSGRGGRPRQCWDLSRSTNSGVGCHSAAHWETVSKRRVREAILLSWIPRYRLKNSRVATSVEIRH